MSTFNTTQLANKRVLVTGDTDEQKCILSSAEWDSIKHHRAHLAADAQFNDAVQEFFAPIVAAAEAAGELVESTIPQRDDDFYFVVSKGVEGTEAQDEEVIALGNDTVILRLIDEGKTDRLVWIGSSIEILAAA